MAVVLCKELFPGRRGSDGIERKLKHTRVFEVLTDDPNDDDYIAGAGDGVTIPRNGDIHPNNPFAVMISITADQDEESPLRWIVVCEYDTELPVSQAREAGSMDATGGSQPGGQGATQSSPGNPLARDDDPTTRPTKWSTATEKTQEVAVRSVSAKTPDIYDGGITWNWGQAIVNSAGYKFDPPAMKDCGYTAITAVKNYPIGHTILSLDTQEAYRDHVNGDVWYGREVGTCRLASINVDYDVENGIPFGRVTFIILYKPFKRESGDIIDGGWNLRLLDCGYYEFDLVEAVEFVLDNPPGSGIPPNEPQMLDGSGFRKAAGDPPVYLEFGVYEDALFNDLGL